MAITGFPNAQPTAVAQPAYMGGQPTAVTGGIGRPSQSFVNADGTINYGALISGLGTAAGGALGSSAAAGAQVTGINNAIGTQQGVAATNTGLVNSGINTQLSNQTANNGLFNPQINTGNAAFGDLTKALTPGSGFSMSDIPGLTGAVNTAETAQSNLFASFGNLGNSGTPAQIGNYIAGNIALPAYNNYVQNLIQTGQLGAEGNAAEASSNLQTGTNISALDQANMTSNLQTGGNISQLQQNAGVANSSGVAGTAGALTGLAGPIGSSIANLIKNAGVGSGANASGVVGTGSIPSIPGAPNLFGSSGAGGLGTDAYGVPNVPQTDFSNTSSTLGVDPNTGLNANSGFTDTSNYNIPDASSAFNTGFADNGGYDLSQGF